VPGKTPEADQRGERQGIIEGHPGEASMVRDTERLRRFEDELSRSHKADYRESLAVFEALWEHALRLGVLPARNVLEGIDVDVRLAKALNVRNASGVDRPRS
jgi:hypothetical protein